MAASQEPDPYVVLNVPRSATPEQIREAYRALGARYHPDLHQGNPLEDLAAARMAEINRAYELLSDPARRAACDAGATARTDWTAADRVMRGRFLKSAALLLVVPLVFRTGAVILRAAAALGRLLLEATGGFRWQSLLALVGLVGLLTLVLPRRNRRPR